MKHITNNAFTENEKTILEFVLQHALFETDTITDQLNKLKANDIVRDHSPHHWIMEFRAECAGAGYVGMTKTISFRVLHDDMAASTVFNLYERDGCIFECEIFNDDSSEMDMRKIMIGQIYVE